jgi:hypothetical protein
VATGAYAVCFWSSAIIFGASVDVDLIAVLTASVFPHSFRAHVERCGKWNED